MVQLRIMTDDIERGEDVTAILLPLLQACTALHVGEPTRLRHRAGGLRLVLDVQPAGPPTVRLDREPARRRTPRRRTLPGRGE